jgi:hypothetical protein
VRRHATFVIVLSSVAFALGCPSTSPTPAQIEDVTVKGDPRTAEFTLNISGRGFATEVTYDLSKAQGDARPTLRVEAVNARSGASVLADSNDITVVSPREIVVEMRDPLAAGTWGVRIYRDAALTKILAEKEAAFVVGEGEVEDPDAGVVSPDATDIPVEGDATVVEDAGVSEDSGVPEDVGVPDTGERPDSGLGPFVGNYLYRRNIALENPSLADSPVNTTIAVPVDHANLVAAAMAKADASDISLYLGTGALEFQWEDATKIGTNDLVMIARLNAAIPVGPYLGAPLVMYFGDPALTTVPSDALYTFAERFPAQVNNNQWFVNSGWYHCTYDHAVAGPAMVAGAYCVQDGDDSPTKRSLATPLIAAIGAGQIAANQIYDLTLWTAGRMISQNNDLFYLAYDSVNDEFENTTLIPAASWIGFQPNVAGFTFQENGGDDRTVEGWRYLATEETWKRSSTRFVSAEPATALHFRFVSKDNDDNSATFVAIDDVTVRVALNPDFRVIPGPVEPR